MKYLNPLLLLLTLACCAGPKPEPADEAAVFEPSMACRVGRDGGPVVADRGIGGTGVAARTRTTDRGIGGTGIFGVVTGFASICVDGLEVRFDKSTAVSLNGTMATAKQLRAGQVVVIEAGGQETPAHSVDQTRTIAVRYEVSGPIEAVDSVTGAMMVAGQRVKVLPATWVASRFGVGDWTTVSGLRQPDGTVMASRLDRARVGVLFVRGRLTGEGDMTRIGGLVLRGPLIAIVKTGSFVSIAGRYADGVVEVTSIDADPVAGDPTGYFATSAQQVVLQAFIRVDRGMVWLTNGRTFQAGAAVQGQGNSYRNAVVRLERTASGAFIATELHYTAYRARPADAPAPSRARKAEDLVLPPEPPPGPPPELSPPDAPDENKGINDAPSLVPDLSDGSVLISRAAPPQAGSSGDRLAVTGRNVTLPPGVATVIE